MTQSRPDAALAVLGRPEPDREERGPKPKITLPRVAFLERPLPDWWDEPIPPPRKPASKKGR